MIFIYLNHSKKLNDTTKIISLHLTKINNIPILHPLLEKETTNSRLLLFDYSLTDKKSNIFSGNYKNSIQIKDTFNHKYLSIRTEHFPFTSSYKNIIFNKLYIHHLLYNKFSHSKTQTIQTSFPPHIDLKSSLLLRSFYRLCDYYSFWGRIHAINIKNIKQGNTRNFSSSKQTLEDITSSLSTIENLLELQISTDVIPLQGINIVAHTQTHFDIPLHTKIHQLYLFSIVNRYNYVLHIDTHEKMSYEKASSIISPTTSVFSGFSSINTIINTLYLHKISFLSSSLASKSAHFFVFNAIVESLLKQYLKHGIAIPSLHFEIIADKMTSFVKITHPAESTLFTNDITESRKIYLLNTTMKQLGYKNILYTPIVLGITRSILIQSGALSSFSFQETFKHLTKLSLDSEVDWLTDIKSNMLTAQIIRAGSG